MPYDFPDGKTFWQQADMPTQANMQALAEKLLNALTTLSAYTSDFRTEMQNILVSEVFGHRAPIRVPIDSRCIVVSLDKHAQLMTYFETDTSWGGQKSEIEARVREGLSKNG